MNAESQTANPWTKELETTLLRVARDSIEQGLKHNRALEVDPGKFEPPLQEFKGAFVTLMKGKHLRGCVGTLEANRPLVENVSRHAYFAAFHDSRFDRLTWAEWGDISVHISILSAAEPIHFTSEANLLEQIRPGTDGLILEAEGHRGTFLPSVWETLPDKNDFWRQLKRKAGLLPDYWSDRVAVSRYTTHGFGDEEA